MNRKLKVGETVHFVDEYRRFHLAMVICIHGDPEGCKLRNKIDDNGEFVTNERGIIQTEGYDPGTSWPCLNLLYASPNPDCNDQYGRQIVRPSSAVYQADNRARANCWKFVDEDLLPPETPSES